MAKGNNKRDRLGPLQERILVCLAEQGPQTIRKTAKLLSGHYKSVNQDFHILADRELLTKVGIFEWRNQKYDTFWLTVAGQIMALLNGANVRKTKRSALKLAKEEEQEEIGMFYDIVESLGPQTASKMYRTILGGRMELSFVPIDQTNAHRALNIVKQYPKIWRPFQEKLRKELEP